MLTMSDTSVVVAVGDDAQRLHLAHCLESLPNLLPIPGSGSRVRVHRVDLPSATEFAGLLQAERLDNAILISDEFTAPTPEGRFETTALARGLKDLSIERRQLLALVALVKDPGQQKRAPDIDRIIGYDQDPTAFVDSIASAARALWFKLPPDPHTHLSRGNAVYVKPVDTKALMKGVLSLRYDVYGNMFYLDDEIAGNSLGIELDYFDLSSLHFAAIERESNEIVGTVRLVIPSLDPFCQAVFMPNPSALQAKQKSWCREIAGSAREAVFRKRLRAGYFFSLPIFNSTDFRERWEEVLSPPGKYGEVSRVIVAPKYRGLGVSRALTRMVIAAALSIGKEFLLLECIPHHTKMYEKYGFRTLEGLHSRVQELDQTAASMRLELTDTPDNAAVQLAKRDLRMMARQGPISPQDNSKFLCICELQNCWRTGTFECYGKAVCPMSGHT